MRHGSDGLRRRSKRVTAIKRNPDKRRVGADGIERKVIGWEYVHIAVDDYSWLAYAEVLEDEKATTAIAFLRRALAFYRLQPSQATLSSWPPTPGQQNQPARVLHLGGAASEPAKPSASGLQVGPKKRLMGKPDVRWVTTGEVEGLGRTPLFSKRSSRPAPPALRAGVHARGARLDEEGWTPWVGSDHPRLVSLPR